MGIEKLILNFKRGCMLIAAVLSLSAFLSCNEPSPPEPTPTFISTSAPPASLTPTPLPTGYDYTTTTNIVASKNIDTNGGSLEVIDLNSFLYGSKLTIPIEAMDSDKLISIAEVNNPPALPDGLGYVGSAMDLEPDETNFNFPATATIPYNDEFLSNAGISDDSDLQLYTYNKNSENWTKVDSFSLDSVNNTITAEINHFSYYAITGANAIPPDDLGTPKPGDLLYTLGAFWQESHPIFFNNWMPGHVGIYTGEKKYPGTGLASNDVKKFEIYNVIEALWDGVQYSYYNIPNTTETFESSLKPFNGGNLYMGAREPKNWTLTPQQRLDIVEYAEAQIGKPYAWAQTIGSAFGMLRGSKVKGENEKHAYNCVGLGEAAYEFVGINNGEGLVSEEQEEWIITPAEQYNATKPASGPLTFSVGDRGPARGWILYDKGFYSDGWRYLEVAPYNQPQRIWGTYGLVVPGADKKPIGAGKQNTLDILAGDSAPNKAADECANLTIFNNGICFDDWFLPSALELQRMINLYDRGIGNFKEGAYWSSSEYQTGNPGTTAWCIYFKDHLSTNENKDILHYVRAVRDF